MSLFECTQCHCAENTAMAVEQRMEGKNLCSECFTGEWHGVFPKRSAAGMFVDQRGFLWGSKDSAPENLKIVGQVPAA